MELQQALEQFLEAIKSSEAYKDYEYQKQRIKKYPGLSERINEFRKRRFEFQNYEGDDLFEKIDEFEKEFNNFEEEPVVREYLAAELEICRRIQEINAAITDVIDIDMDLL
ncbi:MAG: YlbF family regulator [Lachnospiraceae bacterium]